MIISIAIMAHPKRRQRANLLLAKLAAYPFKQCYITWDEQNDEWHTGERAMRSGVAVGSDWHVVLQDDAIIPDDFYNHVEGALKHVPERTLVSFYTGTVKPYGERTQEAVEKAIYGNATWIKHYVLLWGVGIAIPTFHIEPMLEFVADRQEQYDTRIGLFYQSNILPVFYTNPSLVDHDDDLGSLLGHGATEKPRIAHNFVAGSVNWGDQVVNF